MVIADQLELGQALAEQGMATADLNADRAWRSRVDDAIALLAAGAGDFTAEDVRALAGDPPAGTSPNAMGALLHAAARRRWIRRIGYRPARRPSLHAHPIAVWIGWEPPQN